MKRLLFLILIIAFFSCKKGKEPELTITGKWDVIFTINYMPMSEYYDLMVLTQNSDNSLTGTFDFFTNNDNSLLPISKVKNDSVFFDFQNPDTIFTFRGTINRDFNSMSGYCNVRLLLVDPAHNIFYGTWGANKK